MRAASAASSASAAAAAAPKPAMPATFSVPARSAALLAAAPDQRLGDMAPSRAPNERADALADRRSCARKASKIGAERLDIAGDAAGRLDGVDVQQAAGRMHDQAAISATG